MSELPSIPETISDEVADSRHRVYTAFLDELPPLRSSVPLACTVRRELAGRGISLIDIISVRHHQTGEVTNDSLAGRGYRPFPWFLNKGQDKDEIPEDLRAYASQRAIISHLLSRGLESDLAQAPGFKYVEDEKNGPYWKLKTLARWDEQKPEKNVPLCGFILPIRDRHGRIVSLKIRQFDEQCGKYQLFTYGGQSESLIHHARPRPDAGQTTEIIITEGELKADIAAMKFRRPAIGLPGTVSVVDVVDQIRQTLSVWNVRRVMVSPDGDFRDPKKQNVGQVLLDLVGLLRRLGIEFSILTWREDLKGIDDFLYNRSPDDRITRHASPESINSLLASVYDLTSNPTSSASSTGTAEPSATAIAESSAATSASAAIPEFRIDFIDSPTFAATQYERRFLVNGILVDRQPCIIGGRHKSMKTSIAVDLAYSLGTGSMFLQKFIVPERVPVLVLSGESGAPTLQETAARIASGRGRMLSAADVCWGFRLPKVSKPDHLAALGQAIRGHGFRVVIIDPAYLCLLAGDTQGRQVSNLFDMGSLFTELGELFQETGATPLLVHHLKKNTLDPKSTGVPELEDLAFAGFAEWARQWILLGRRKPFESGSGLHELWLNVGGSMGHAGCWAVDVFEGNLDESFQGRCWNVTVRTATDVRQHRRDDKSAGERERVLEALRAFPAGETKTTLRTAASLSGEAFNCRLAELLREGLVEPVQVAKGNRNLDGFRLSATDPGDVFGSPGPTGQAGQSGLSGSSGSGSGDPDSGRTHPVGVSGSSGCSSRRTGAQINTTESGQPLSGSSAFSPEANSTTCGRCGFDREPGEEYCSTCAAISPRGVA